MDPHQSLPFLNAVSKHSTSYTYEFKKIRTVNLLGLASEEVQGILYENYLKNYKKQLKQTMFQIQVEDKYKSWRIIKRFSNFMKLQSIMKEKYKIKITIPFRQYSEINRHNQDNILDFFVVFLTKISSNIEIQNDIDFRKFIENNVAADQCKIKTYKQLTLEKKGGGRHSENAVQKIFSNFKGWNSQYFTVFSEGIYYTQNQTIYQAHQTLGFSKDFDIFYGGKDTGRQFGINIKSDQRILKINASNIIKLILFVYWVKIALKQSISLGGQRFESFANIRQQCFGIYYVDGKNYFSDIYDALITAKKQVFITGWMLSPFFKLKRNDNDDKTRLDNVLKKIASNGIEVKIIIYMEPKIALNIDSEFTQSYLCELSDNIKVLRHPPFIMIPFLWSHHEKMVIIDQKIGFMGGLDIGYGRMDDSRHLISDQLSQYWSGVDYCNFRKTDILRPRKYLECSIKRQEQPRMPWHDIGIQLKGSSVFDLSRHFIQYWNHVNFQKNLNQRQLLMCAGYQQSLIHPVKQEDDSSQFNLSNLRLSQIPQEEMNFYTQNLNLGEINQNSIVKVMTTLKHANSRQGINLNKMFIDEAMPLGKVKQGKQKHQILRSASNWGLGLQTGKQQKSILNAYIKLISNAKQFIYIENQFFISVENPVSIVIVERIKKAYANKQKFKIIVVFPSLPGFQGEPENPNASILRIQLHLQYQTICRGKKSIFKQLAHIENLSQYIQFLNLRTHGKIGQNVFTEIIYVHSKLMIVDDLIVLIGSANINDRSLLGTRDSEIAVVVEDEETIEVKINGANRLLSKFAHSLRIELFKQHFGLSQDQVSDYLCEKMWKSISNNSRLNHQIYQTIFGCYPDNQIKNYNQISELKQKADTKKYDTMIPLIKGHAVPFQKDFLAQQDLSFKPASKQNFIPFISFT